MSLFDPYEVGEYYRSLWRCESTLNPSLYRQYLGAFSPTGIRFKRHDVHPRKFLPLVKMLKVKHSSLWSSLSFSQQEELLTLLEQMKSEEQDRLLRVMKQLKVQKTLDGSNWLYYIFNLYFTRYEETLLSLLTRLHSIDRSNLLRMLEPMDPQEQRKLIRVMDRLKESERRELLGILAGSISKLSKLVKEMKDVESLIQRLLLLFVYLLSIYLSKNDPQRGFKNLLLDGWWLEFWEIILLAAGDVERNPGPTFMTEKELAAVSNAIIEEDDLSDIFDNVFPISSKWPQFCFILGLQPSLLDTISENHHGDCGRCLFEGVKHWLQGNYNTEKHGPPTWRKLVAAIDNSAGGSNHALAKRIAEKHSDKGTSTQTVLKPAGDDNDRDREESRGGHQHSADFSKMYGAITRSIGRSLAVDDLTQFLHFFSHPHSPSQRYIQPSVYMGVESTRDILDQLYPAYVNPGNIYLLEEIVELSNSRQCKRLLKEYTNKYH